ncbi:MAG: histidine triad nucleotide-binding protein [Dehalococcoidia bacterium]|jgi:histidine triad (HIT) family protein
MDCIFCKIVAGEIPSTKVYEDEEIIAFRDINPQAPVHIVIIPRQHIASLSDLSQGDSALVGRLVTVANKLAKDEGISEKGYRVVINCGPEGGQLVPHLHLHLVGGRKLSDQVG